MQLVNHVITGATCHGPAYKRSVRADWLWSGLTAASSSQVTAECKFPSGCIELTECAGAGIRPAQLAASRLMVSVVGSIESLTWLFFVFAMVPVGLRSHPLSAVACLLSSTAAFYLHHRCA